MPGPTDELDFFISYRGSDSDWARWINWVVRSAGYSTILMDEFPTGTTWPAQMRDACQRCRRLIPVYSNDYWKSGATRLEFDAYLTREIENNGGRFLVPLAIEECTPDRLERGLLFRPLHGLDRDAARAAVLAAINGIAPVLAGGACHCGDEPFFPGHGAARPGSTLSPKTGRVGPYQPEIPLPPLKVLIACSSANEGFARTLRSTLRAFRLAASPAREAFDAKLMREAGDDIRRVVEDADIVLVLIECADEKVCRVLDLASRCQIDGRNRHPKIIGVVAGDYRTKEGGWNLPLVCFEAGRTNMGCHDFGDVEFVKTPEDAAFCERIHDDFHPRFTVIADVLSFENHKSLFDQAMEIYERLIPVTAERDDPGNIEKWICNSSGDRDNWLDYLVVAHFPAGEVFGAFWCNIDIRTGIGHVPFWGMLPGYRSANVGVHLAGTAMQEGERLLAGRKDSQPFKGVVFEAEPVDLGFFSEIVAEACKELDPPEAWPHADDPERWQKQTALLGKLKRRPGRADAREANAIERALLTMTADAQRAEDISEALRRFRRFSLYAQGSASSGRMGMYGFRSVGFIDSARSRERDHQMAVYWQPPIIANHHDKSLPVLDEDKCPFSLFMLVKESVSLSPAEVVDWEYDKFLGEQFGDEAPSGLTGWNDYMVKFKETHRTTFIQSAEMKNVQVGQSYDVAEFVLRAVSTWPKSRPDWKTIEARIPSQL